MSEQHPDRIMQLTTAPAGSALGRWQRIVRVVAISVPVIGAIPTGINLYQSWQHKIPYSDVSFRLAQAELWMKNQDCPMTYKALNAATGTRIEAGACPRTGDVGVRLTAAQTGTIAYEWIPAERLKKTTTAALFGFIGSAEAAELPAGAVQLAQAAPAAPPAAGALPGVQAVCQSKQGNSIVRVMKDGAKCFREVFSPYRGQVEKREDVACNTPCPR